MSPCVSRYSRFTLSAYGRPLNAFPLLSTHCASLSRQLWESSLKFSAGTTCSHSIFPAHFSCFGSREIFRQVDDLLIDECDLAVDR